MATPRGGIGVPAAVVRQVCKPGPAPAEQSRGTMRADSVGGMQGHAEAHEDQEVVVLTVKDRSSTVPSPVVVEDPDIGGHGRGIWIVQIVSREWGVIADGEGGKSVWAWFETDEAPD